MSGFRQRGAQRDLVYYALNYDRTHATLADSQRLWDLLGTPLCPKLDGLIDAALAADTEVDAIIETMKAAAQVAELEQDADESFVVKRVVETVFLVRQGIIAMPTVTAAFPTEPTGEPFKAEDLANLPSDQPQPPLPDDTQGTELKEVKEPAPAPSAPETSAPCELPVPDCPDVVVLQQDHDKDKAVIIFDVMKDWLPQLIDNMKKLAKNKDVFKRVQSGCSSCWSKVFKCCKCSCC